MQKNKLHTPVLMLSSMVCIYLQYPFYCFLKLLRLTNSHTKVDRLYLVYNSFCWRTGIETSRRWVTLAAPALKAEDIGIEKATRHKYARSVKHKDIEKN